MITFTNETLDVRRAAIYDLLKEKVCVVTFTKVDGTRREMPCTLSESMIPPAPVHVTNTNNPVDFPKTKKTNPAVMSVFCTDKQEWRSFRLENVIEVKPQE